MLRVSQILASRFALVASLAALGAAAGCGQRGPLFLPSDVPANARATLVQTLQPDAVFGQPDQPPETVAPTPVPAAPPSLLPVSDAPVPSSPVSAPARTFAPATP